MACLLTKVAAQAASHLRCNHWPTPQHRTQPAAIHQVELLARVPNPCNVNDDQSLHRSQNTKDYTRLQQTLRFGDDIPVKKKDVKDSIPKHWWFPH
jgi:hypothetical protein